MQRANPSPEIGARNVLQSGSGGPAIHLPLAAPRLRMDARGSSFSLAFLLILFVGALIGTGILWVAVADEPGGFRLVMALFATGVAGGLGCWAYISLALVRETHRARPEGVLAVSGGSLTITDPSVFTAPLTISPQEIRAVAVDSAPRRIPSYAWSRFPIGSTECLWRPWFPCPLPIASVSREAPNVVVLFDRPRRFPTATDGGAMLDTIALTIREQAGDAESSEDLRGAPPVDSARQHAGLFLSVADPAAATEALAPLAQYRTELSAEDVRPVAGRLPVPGPVARIGTWAVRGYLAVAAVLVAVTVTNLVDAPVIAPLMAPLVVVPPAHALWFRIRAARRARQRTAV